MQKRLAECVTRPHWALAPMLHRVNVGTVTLESTASNSQEVARMPAKQHLPSVSDKEQRMYEHVKESEQKQGRSTKRAKEIAARTVNKHHSQKGHSEGK
jgi:hypothetical protein